MSWKKKYCSQCDFCVDRRCRDAKPVQGRYSVVVGVGTGASDTKACSGFKPKTKTPA